ncbi:MAG: 50S ribosomal protein L28 [Patescibacteria group bacterium]
MAKFCDICGRGGLVGNSRSHSNIATKQKRQVNLQTKRVDGNKFKVCTKCIKTAAKRQTALKVATA